MDPRCPDCHGSLEPGDDSWPCLACGRAYPALRGIPDLRTADDLYLPNEEDWAIARVLHEHFDRLDFRSLLRLYFDVEGEPSEADRSRQVGHILSAPGRSGQWVDRLGRGAEIGPVLDLGCGSGSFLAARARSLGPAVGLDIAMRWLILARKRLHEEGLGAVLLVCGCAEDLPFPANSFRAIVAGDVIEHVNHQEDALNESHRILRDGGRLILATPNRYSLAPEPHVGVWGVGFLPREWMGLYVRILANKNFHAIRTCGWSEWKRIAARSDFAISHIEAPELPRDDLARFGPIKRGMARLYNAAVGSWVGQEVAKRVGPLFHILLEKGAPSAPQPIPATRPRSRQQAGRP